tara:strand:+ start:1478 stop:3013 length:1536 start_codon:yes stop_codon:yes gene_type:complete
MITLKNIVDEFQTFVDDHLFLKTFSYGSPSSVDLDKFTDYPLLHLVYNGSGYDENEKTYSFDLYILDAPPVGVDPAGKDAYEKQAVTSAEQVSEDILADLENGGKIFQFAYGYEIVSSRTVPLMEQTSGVLTGVLFSLSIATPYLYDACNAPLTGVTPGGSSSPSSSLTGVLRVREVDGSPNVSNVDTIVVTNGTLTDDGSGVVTIDTGAGGGAVDSVNGEVGVVVLDTDDVSEGTVNKYMVLGTSGTTALAGNTTTITGGQATEIADNTLKVGYTDGAVDARIASADLNDLNDVTITGASSGEVLKWSGSEWINGTGGGGATTLDGLSDVDTTGVADKQALVYDNSASEWVAGFPGTSGAVSTFLAESSKVNNYVSGFAQNVILGSILSGELVTTADMKAGWTAGFDAIFTATTLLCAQVTAGSTMQMFIKYDITLGTATYAFLSNVITGNMPVLSNFAVHTSDASNVTSSSNVSTIVTYQTSNTTKLQINANGTGTVKILEFKAVVVHA